MAYKASSGKRAKGGYPGKYTRLRPNMMQQWQGTVLAKHIFETYTAPFSADKA